MAFAAAVAIKSELPHACLMTSMAGLSSLDKEIEDLQQYKGFRNAIDILDAHQYGILGGEVENYIPVIAKKVKDAGYGISLTETSPVFYGQLPKFFSNPRNDVGINQMLHNGTPLSEIYQCILRTLDLIYPSCIYAPKNAVKREAQCLELMRRWLLAAKAADYAFIGPFPPWVPLVLGTYCQEILPNRTEEQVAKAIRLLQERLIANTWLDEKGELTPIGEMVKEVFGS